MGTVESVDDGSWRLSPERQVGRRRSLLALVTSLLAVIVGITLWAVVSGPGAFPAARTEFENASSVVAQRVEELTSIRESITATEVELASEIRGEEGAAGCGLVCLRLKDALNLKYAQADNRINELAAAESRRDEARAALVAAEAADNARILIVASIAAAALLVALLVHILLLSIAKSRYQERVSLERLRSLSNSSMGSADAFDVLIKLKDNDLRLRTYHELVTSYASGTRILTIVSLVAGLLFAAACGVAASLSGSVSGAIAGGVAAASVSAMTGFVVTAVLRNAEASSQEVRAFFLHPIQQERTLTAERLLSQLEGDQRDEALRTLISALSETAVTTRSSSTET